MLRRFIPPNQLRPVQPNIEFDGLDDPFDLTMEERKRKLALNLNFIRVKHMPVDERKVKLADDFKFNWVKMMPRDMVREFHKNLDYESRIAELLHKYPFIRRGPGNGHLGSTLDNYFTNTQIIKIWQEGFVKKITDAKHRKRVLKNELVEMFPERPARIYADVNGNEQVWTGIRHKVITDFERGARPLRGDGVVGSRDIRGALMYLLNVRTEFPVFDRFLRRTAYYLISGIIIFRETVTAARKKREAAAAAKVEANLKAYELKRAARIQAIVKLRKERQAAILAAKKVVRDALQAEMAGMRAEEKATRDLAKAHATAQAKAAKQAAKEQANAEKQVAKDKANAEKQAAKEQANAEKQAAKEQVKVEKQAAKVVAREQAKAEKQAAKVAAREQAKATKAAVVRGVKVVAKAKKEVDNNTSNKCEAIQRVFRGFLGRRGGQVSVE